MCASLAKPAADHHAWMALLEQAQALEARQRWPEAERCYRQILAPPRPASLNDHMVQVVRLQLGANLKSQGRFDDAIAVLDEIPRTDRDNTLRAGAALSEIRQLQAQSKREIHKGIDTIRRDPQSPWGYRDLVHGLQLAGRGAHAIAYAQEQLGAEFGANHALQLAQAAADIAQWPLATLLHREALLRHPDDPRMRPALLALLGSHGPPEQAIAAYLEAIALTPGDRSLRRALAIQYERAGLDAAAIAVYTELIETQPADIDAYLSLGAALERNHQWDAAVAIYLRCIRQAPDLGPGDPRRHAPRASAYARLVRVYTRRDQLQRLLELAPPAAAAVYYPHLALALEYAGHGELAERVRARKRAQPE